MSFDLLIWGLFFIMVVLKIEWLSMTTTALLVISFVLVLLIGNFMGAKPNHKEMRLDSVRMTARKLQLSPKLVKIPEFLNNMMGKNHQESNKSVYDYDKTETMITQYTLVNDNWQLPKAVFLLEGGRFHLLNNYNDIAKTYLERQSQKFSKNAQILAESELSESLENFLPFLKAVTIQANSISLFWYDEKWVNGLGRHLGEFDVKNNQKKADKSASLTVLIEQELSLLKKAMGEWADAVASAKR